MAVTVNIDLGYEFDVKAKAADVFEVLSDVPTSVSHFPKVDKLTDMGDGVFKWEMEKVGTAQVNIHDRIPVNGAHPEDQVVSDDPGAVDQHGHGS